MPLLSQLAKEKKRRYFLDGIRKDAAVLEIGSGSGWVRDYMTTNGWTAYVGLDLVPPAEIIGDIRKWQSLGLEPASFDYIIAFEVVEHVDCFAECYDLLKEGGLMLLTTPLPAADRFLEVLEYLGLNQKRTSPHNSLVMLDTVPVFEHKDVRIVGLLSQWAVFTKKGN